MSYILDALQRADAERTRGSVPGLHARQMTTPTLQAASNGRSRIWLAVVALLLLAAVAAGLWFWPTPARETRLTAASTVMQPTLRAPLPQALPMPATPSPAAATAAPKPIATPAATPASASLAHPAPAPIIPPPTAVAPLPSQLQAAMVAKTAVPVASTPPTALPMTKAVAKVSATQAEPISIPLLSELSEDIRRQIPALVITGAVYSDNPAQRLLLVNNQVLTQGSLAASEVKLEEIQAKSSVFSFRGTRFRLAH